MPGFGPRLGRLLNFFPQSQFQLIPGAARCLTRLCVLVSDALFPWHGYEPFVFVRGPRSKTLCLALFVLFFSFPVFSVFPELLLPPILPFALHLFVA